MSVVVSAGLNSTHYALPGGGANPVGESAEMPLVVGQLYELRCSEAVHVLAGAGSSVSLRALQVRPDTPLVFRADVAVATVAAASASASVWLREVT